MKKLSISVGIIIIVVIGAVIFVTSRGLDNKDMGIKPATEQSTATQDAVATNSVTITNFTFSPAIITVKKGTTVTWTNKDGVAHSVVMQNDQDGPKSERLQTDDNYSYTFKKTGTYNYICGIHPSMKGTVIVTE